MLLDSHDRVGGQIAYSHWVDNYPPFSVGFSGAYYSSESRAQLARFGVEVVLDTPVTQLKKHDSVFTVNDRYLSKTVLVATGLSPNTHDFPVWSDGSCNIVTGPELTPTLHKDDRVVIYGAGNSAGQAANYYVSQGAQVIVMSRRPASESMDLYLINQLRDRGVTFIVQQIRQVSKDGFLLGDRWSGYPSRLHVFTGTNNEYVTCYVHTVTSKRLVEHIRDMKSISQHR